GIDICKDCGENAISTVVELCGRVLLILLALPLFLTLAETVLEVMQ
ncbi:MAG: stage III sporulation protein AD, partial [Oscillospiraceae bacterium]|nr:stage III sporulation protein AD [Oscillospiraceae bacterium]